ncbi:hypothetical protein [endosymbiont GvMRE of Glomus versiforme]|uniref:hypothetical protein n=1 Tax=endosymbiont GvMRE of Glomus versiforme TaxID=2039283 RepID=UPI000EEC6BA2|nr:hypothetical protein [endosymbiont GvMRE of Glomus versiforme]RHZ36577.1 hypothetical protein GvMRE_I2g524 [endosymbiont GvMRE of Glomus versiforme]
MLKLDIKYDNGETRHITNDLNMEQLKSLVGYIENGTGALAHFTEIKITNNKIKS